MKNLKLISILLAFLSFTVISCDEDDAEQVIIDSAFAEGTDDSTYMLLRAQVRASASAEFWGSGELGSASECGAMERLVFRAGFCT